MSDDRLYHEVHGSTGPYLLLVHGMLSSRSQWRLNLAALAEFCRPVVVELWGHGRSPAPEADESYHPDGYVAAFEALRRDLGVERWWICGQSFGAALTLRYALDHPDRIAGQIFTNSSSALADADTVAQRMASIEEWIPAMASDDWSLQRLPIHPVHAKRLPPAVQQEMLADCELHDTASVVRTFRFTQPHLSVRQRIVDNQVPVLLVCGEREERFAPFRAHAEAFLPHLQVAPAEAGHAVNIEAAEHFNQAVADFMRASKEI
ncbi:MAG TPA: alpha/beta hydrolase [Alphaproteobacteria bacterium]|jgi:pimeloyl-ACP methyl ester carboxylesterase|nr:alpha/beta hydrolase [Alphaproteobacteria bacterium]MDP7428207.1 alpha/beta hydrolase [Alphaproteobacteria bacterium]HJM50340.1 alpha/beta hydrolase [Alphaproteobacteria bacterium]